MSLLTKISTIVDPSIKLEEMAVMDTETSDGTDRPADSMTRKSEIVGDISPFIKIEQHIFNFRNIVKLELDETGFMPTIRVTLNDDSGAFSSAYFPKNNPIMSVYIKAKNDKHKPIRNDYLITDIATRESNDEANSARGIGHTINVTGVLFLPSITRPKSLSFKNMLSIDALIKIMKDVQAGFATNEDLTNDSMTWLMPYMTYADAIQHIMAHSYKDIDSFYTGFFDKYYCFNFININNMFTEEMDFDKMLHSVISYKTYLKDDNVNAAKENTEGTDLFMSNLAALKGSDIFIRSFKPVTQQGRILSTESFIKKIGYYDALYSQKYSENFLEFFIEPNNGIIPDNEIMRSNESRTWLGIDYNNNHDNYKIAEFQNQHNLLEINKIQLIVTTDHINLNITRGMRVPIVIMEEGYDSQLQKDAELVEDNKGTESQKDLPIRFDKYYTGFYYVNGLKYFYNAVGDGRFSFKTIAYLSKKKWEKTPPINKDVENNNL